MPVLRFGREIQVLAYSQPVSRSRSRHDVSHAAGQCVRGSDEFHVSVRLAVRLVLFAKPGAVWVVPGETTQVLCALLAQGQGFLC